jgi:thiosulfate dehydrogenase [quinone] large subunit
MARYSIAESWRSQSLGTRLLRLMLGGTWLYGGLQKASDATFFDKASPGYIGVQLAGFAKNSPISFILRHMIERATLAGWMIMLGEIAIGIAVLTGVALQAAAIGGALISLTLWLSVTWHVHPYFLGSDTAYLVMWIAFFLLVRTEAPPKARKSPIPNLTDRREVMQMIGVGVSAAIAALAVGGLKKPILRVKTGTKIVALSAFPVGSVMQFNAPDGSPAFLFRSKVGVYAYSAICTHQGCTVGYNATGKTLDCPCHVSRFDPANGGAVLGGPAPAPLPRYNVAISGDSIVTV